MSQQDGRPQDSGDMVGGFRLRFSSTPRHKRRPSGGGGSQSRGPSSRGGYGRSQGGRGSSYGGRPQGSSYGGRSQGGRSFGGGRPQRGNAHRGQDIHYSKFIRKAESVAPEAPYEPKHTFSDFQIDERLKANIIKKGYVTPTPIQDQSIPVALTGRDIVGLAETGTGKTAAFLIPLIDKVLKNPDEKVLIMAPTRELAVQIGDEFRGFVTGLGLHSVTAVGGANINQQIRDLRRGGQFLIGTPGRLMDLMERGELNLAKCSNVVLDEADRMLDMGFIVSMRFILAKMNPVRHTLFFSATLSNDIEKLIGEFLNDPVRVSVKKHETSKNVDQDIIRVAPGKTKFDHLAEMLQDREFTKVLVFGRTKHGVEKLYKALKQSGFAVESIHGNKTHGQRQRSLNLFKDERVNILVATDVAARGLDIPKVTHVINFDQPNSYDDYVHRIGRTGRAGETGKALTFVE
jgi:ATP-dependent RNA helicase RhlE